MQNAHRDVAPDLIRAQTAALEEIVLVATRPQ